ncbi:hypothetical protein QO179_23555 [Bacillus stercoris]|nr:hypothetical protein [Bacillus stercoris]
MSKFDLTAQLAAQAQGRFFGPQPPEAYDKATNIVVAGMESFVLKRLLLLYLKQKLGKEVFQDFKKWKKALNF